MYRPNQVSSESQYWHRSITTCLHIMDWSECWQSGAGGVEERMWRGHTQCKHALIHINSAGLITHSTDLALHYCVLDQTADAHTHTHTPQSVCESHQNQILVTLHPKIYSRKYKDLDLSAKMEALDPSRAEMLRSHVAFMPL